MANDITKSGSQDAPATSNSQSFSTAVHARHAEYTRPQKIKVKIGSWNTAARSGAENDLGTWFNIGKQSPNHGSETGMKSSYGIEPQNLHIDESEKTEKLNMKDNYAEIQNESNISLYVLGLQEVSRLNTPKQYIGMINSDPEPIDRWRKALQDIIPSNYVQIVEHQSSGLLLFIYASPFLAPKIGSVSTVTVGTGMMGYLKNKGAIVTRIVIGETTRLVFINSHLTSGADQQQFERRCWDVNQILQKTVFEPVKSNELLENSMGHIGDEDIAFWFGDLNFRLVGIPGDEIRRLLMMSTNGEYNSRQNLEDIALDDSGEDNTFIIRSDSDDEEEIETSPGSKIYIEDIKRENIPSPIFGEQDDFALDPSQDPSSLQSILNSLLPHDQLKYAQSKKRAFHDGWREGQISFLPTYKYDIGGEGSFDTSEKKRAPSWCDRILYRTRQDKLKFEEELNPTQLSQSLYQGTKTKKTTDTDQDSSILFDYNPLEDGLVKIDISTCEASRNENLKQKNTEEKLELDVYTSHQQVLSSDHKPIHAIFTLSYGVVLPEIKAKIQQEVAKDLDRAENEGRPGVTIVIDDSTNNPLSNSPQEGAGVLDFGYVAYDDRIIRNLTIANTGRVPATFTFLDRLSVLGDNDVSAPSWMSVFFVDPEMETDESEPKITKQEVTLIPGDAINARFELHVQDIELIRALNENSRQLEDILVLRVMDGRDHFIPVRGSWLQTCLGRSISQLVRIPEEGARTLSSSEGILLWGKQDKDVCCSTPRELLKLTEILQSLMERTIADSNILEEAQIPQDAPGWPFDSKYWILKDSKKRNVYKKLIVEALDTDKDLNKKFSPETLAIEKLEIVSEVLLFFLSCLPDGIITSNLWSTLEESYPNRSISVEETKAWTLDILSVAPNHSISFVFLTSMLAQVITELVPASKLSIRTGNISIDTVLRGGISWKAKLPNVDSVDFTQMKREQVERAFTEIFLPVIFRDNIGQKERERKVSEEKRKIILQAFLNSTETVDR